MGSRTLRSRSGKTSTVRYGSRYGNGRNQEGGRNIPVDHKCKDVCSTPPLLIKVIGLFSTPPVTFLDVEVLCFLFIRSNCVYRPFLVDRLR